MRTVHGRFLLRPSRTANDLVAGVIGRAQRKHGMKIHGLVVLSGHWHALLTPDSSQQLAAFMDFVAGNIAREIGRLHDWRETFWARRYRAIVVSDELAGRPDGGEAFPGGEPDDRARLSRPGRLVRSAPRRGHATGADRLRGRARHLPGRFSRRGGGRADRRFAVDPSGSTRRIQGAVTTWDQLIASNLGFNRPNYSPRWDQPAPTPHHRVVRA
jgi:hypothetical protein